MSASEKSARVDSIMLLVCRMFFESRSGVDIESLQGSVLGESKTVGGDSEGLRGRMQALRRRGRIHTTKRETIIPTYRVGCLRRDHRSMPMTSRPRHHGHDPRATPDR